MSSADLLGSVSRRKDFVVASISFITSIFIAINSFKEYSEIIFSHTYLIILTLWVVSLFSAWPPRHQTSNFGFVRENDDYNIVNHYKYVVIICAFYIISTLLFTYEVKYRKVGGSVPMIDPFSWIDIISPVRTALAKDDSIRLEQFTLLVRQTSFIESKNKLDFSDHSPDGATIAKSYEMNPQWFSRGYDNCMVDYVTASGDLVDNDIATMDAFEYYLKKSGKMKYEPYIENIFINKDRSRPDIEKNLYPSSAELKQMLEDTKEPNSKRHVLHILNWERSCVGIPYPVFRVAISNKNQHETAQITQINYIVEDLGGYKAVENGLFSPTARFVFPLNYKTGKQVNDVTGQIVQIEPGKIENFDLVIFNDDNVLGKSWKLKVEIVTNLGSARTETFQILMSGRKFWNSQNFK